MNIINRIISVFRNTNPIPYSSNENTHNEEEKVSQTVQSTSIIKQDIIQQDFQSELEKYKDEIDLMSDQEVKELIDAIVEKEWESSIDNIVTARDPMFMEAGRLVVIHQQGSTSLIQRKLKLGYNRAGNIIDQLEEFGIVGPFEGSKARDVLITDLNTLEYLYKSDLENFKFTSRPPIHRLKLQLFCEKYEEDIENKRKQKYLDEEKERLKNKIIEKTRIKALKELALKELREDGIIYSEANSQHRKREPIPQDIMDKVWNRDAGKCVKCDSQENLEFDHIIPFSKGGANTYRNLQILCKKCNIEKSNKIG